MATDALAPLQGRARRVAFSQWAKRERRTPRSSQCGGTSPEEGGMPLRGDGPRGCSPRPLDESRTASGSPETDRPIRRRVASGGEEKRGCAQGGPGLFPLSLSCGGSPACESVLPRIACLSCLLALAVSSRAGARRCPPYLVLAAASSCGFESRRAGSSRAARGGNVQASFLPPAHLPFELGVSIKAGRPISFVRVCVCGPVC